MGRRKVIVECCNKKLSPDVSYSIQDYPNCGDTTELHPAICPKCQCQRYAYTSFNFFGWSTGLLQADKVRRLKFDSILQVGRYRVIEKLKPGEKPVKAAQVAGEFTMRVKRPAEENIHYLNQIDAAEAQGIVSLADELLCG